MTDDSTVAEDAAGGPETLVAGDLRLDLRDERLWRGGQPVRLGGKAFALIRRLMQTPQVLVTKDQLFDAVWPGLAVSESVLTTAVKELRQALGDDARRPTLIETVHGRGYRFLLPVGEGETLVPSAAPPSPKPAASPRPGRRGLLIAAGAIAAALLLVAARLLSGGTAPLAPGLHPKSVVVMPFADLSPDGGDRWFADGLTEEVMSTLARTADLRIAARPPEGQDLAAAVKAHRAAHILTGSVRRAGGRVRVTVELVRSSDGVHVWSQSYDRPNGDIISIQEDVGLRIAQALKTATDPAKLRAMSAAGTRSVEAYEAYLRGIGLARRQRSQGDLADSKASAEAYEQARQLDPTFAAAQWKSAQTWFGNATRVDSAQTGEGPTDSERLARFFERVDAAIVASPDETESLKYRAARAMMQIKFRQARRLEEAYLKSRPRDIDAWEDLANLGAYTGDRRAIAAAARQAARLAQEAGEPRSREITLMVMAGRSDEAADLARRQLAQRPDSALMLYQGHRAMIWAGRIDEARGLLERLRASGIPESSRQLAELRQACADRRIVEARAIYAKLSAAKRLTSRFNAAQVMGDRAAIARDLGPLDAPDRLRTLMQFMIYPSFDPRPYPNLIAALKADGLTPLRPITVPYACPAR